MQGPIDKEHAVALLVAECLPLLTPDIQLEAARLDRDAQSPPPSRQAALELIKLNPGHFADLIFSKTAFHKTKGNTVYLTTEDREIHDVDVEIVRRYLRAGQYLAYRFRRLSKVNLFNRLQPLVAALYESKETQGHDTDAGCAFSMPWALLDDSRVREWLSYDCWSFDEAIALSLGRNPEVVTPQSVAIEVGNRFSHFQNEFEKRRRLLDRAVTVGALSNPSKPNDFIDWAMSKNLISEDEALYKFALHIFSEREHESQNIASKQIKRKLFRMILVMAIDKYRHNLVSNSKAHSAIANQFIEAGFKMTGETIGDTLDDIVNDPLMTDDMELIREYWDQVSRRPRSKDSEL